MVDQHKLFGFCCHICIIVILYKNIVCLVLNNLSLIKMVFKCVNNLAPEMICPLMSKQSSKGITKEVQLIRIVQYQREKLNVHNPRFQFKVHCFGTA